MTGDSGIFPNEKKTQRFKTRSIIYYPRSIIGILWNELYIFTYFEGFEVDGLRPAVDLEFLRSLEGGNQVFVKVEDDGGSSEPLLAEEMSSIQRCHIFADEDGEEIRKFNIVFAVPLLFIFILQNCVTRMNYQTIKL